MCSYVTSLAYLNAGSRSPESHSHAADSWWLVEQEAVGGGSGCSDGISADVQTLLQRRSELQEALSCETHHILTETLHSLHPRFTAVLMSPFVMSGTVLSISRLPSTERKKPKHATLLLTRPQRLRGVLTAAAHKEHHLYLVNMLFLKIRYIAGGCGDRK